MVEVGRQFEAYFVSYLLKVMRDTVHEGSITNKQGAYFYSFYDEEIGRRAAESGGIGIARMVRKKVNNIPSFPETLKFFGIGTDKELDRSKVYNLSGWSLGDKEPGKERQHADFRSWEGGPPRKAVARGAGN